MHPLFLYVLIILFKITRYVPIMIGFRRGRVSKDTNCPDRKDPYGKGTDLPEEKYRYNFLCCYKRYRRVPVTTHSLSVANWEMSKFVKLWSNGYPTTFVSNIHHHYCQILQKWGWIFFWISLTRLFWERFQKTIWKGKESK